MPTQPRPVASVALGRPHKFGRPARAVTMTLPLDVIESLQAIDTDLARAVVRLSGRAKRIRAGSQSARLSRYGRRAVITVDPAGGLRHGRGVELVPLTSRRAPISLDAEVTPEAFELQLRDTLEKNVSESDRAGIREVVDVLTEARRKGGVQLQSRTILVLAEQRNRR